VWTSLFHFSEAYHNLHDAVATFPPLGCRPHRLAALLFFSFLPFFFSALAWRVDNEVIHFFLLLLIATRREFHQRKKAPSFGHEPQPGL